MSVKEFPCTSCGAKLEYVSGQELICPYCGAKNVFEQVEEDIKELDFHDFLRKSAEHEESIEVTTVKCQACGAESTPEENVSISQCSFCGSQLMAQASVSKAIKPKSMLPFEIQREQARENFRKWLKGLWFAPNQVKKYARSLNQIKGMYIPFWTYDADTYTNYRGQRGTDYTEHYTDSDGKRQSRTETRWSYVSGRVRKLFDDVLILASRSLPKKQTDKLEPWDLNNLVPYQEQYLAGFQVETYQIDLEGGFDEARDVMAEGIKREIRRDIGGDHQRIDSMDTSYADITFKHILLPVWISAYKFKDKTYRFVVNARTGEVQGERPWSAWKISAAVTAAAVVIGGAYWYFKVYGG
ncbi:conserved hypothetical protein [Desulfatibacillum aliphaticivorans]|uniref:Primosomal protein N' (Replication factor Y)-superfamily II helicase n=1 Tax=Desulfatibacillum aliphaticivorans TaxID=218208 RepID=B8FFG5_DESAL|nr:hypothetical protein [Desulfatibacillum aliphaticivorans]ACL04225.1 conserved hypothetical protein [Desulfatibacillum aliphaticivorans]